MTNLLTSSRLASFYQKAEQSRLGYLAIIVTAQSLIGFVAICYISELPGEFETVLLSSVAATTMAANALLIAQAPMKYVLQGTVISVVTSIVCTSIAVSIL